ncbi:hypothetical protein IFR05_004971 [Cadophora sp. M221]|nr:hypothetical protein IFR05_004971 [Cadophora sp. M221]
MKITIPATLLALLAVVSGMVIETRQTGGAGANANRPVPTGACCVAATSLKQDVCNVNGQTGRCVPANVNNCGGALTCIEDSRLTCDANTLERGRPLCRLAAGA